MAIASYSGLVSAISEWLARDNDATLVARIPDFITLCEAKLNRGLFHPKMEKRVYASVDTTDDEPEFITLPTDFQSMRRMRLSGVSGKPHLIYKSQTQLDEYRESVSNVSGQPQYYTVFGDELELAKTPDDDYEIEMVYRANIPALTDSNTTNWLITHAPDIYLYGSLLESAPYIKEDARINVWGSGFTAALDGLNRSALTMQFNAQPLAMSTGGYTP